MAKIFICYRREDGKWPAQWIYNDLVNHFGSESVVFDVDTIPLGTDFREYLNNQVSKCDILLAVIGDQWIELLKQRIDQPKDFVRIEIQAALERNIPVVPVLVGEAPVPNEKNLPPELVKLAYSQATEVHAGPDLQTHLKRLMSGLDRLIAERKRKQKEEQKRGETPKTYTNAIGMEFVLIPAGNIMMGSHISPEEAVRKYGGIAELFKREHPQHKVTISEPFYLQATAVTQGQWEKVTGKNPSGFNKCGDDCPVEMVSWDDAQTFVEELNEIEGTDKYRLPTEAEWEYACRGVKITTNFFFGNDVGNLGKYAWFESNSERKTLPVGQKEPNPWGLYDMHGNVWECVADDWHGNYDEAPTDGRAWIDDPRGASRVIRGGSWQDRARYCLSAFRFDVDPDSRYDTVGFRLARSVTLGP